MGTRSGDIDPALVLYLMRKENVDVDRVESFLNKECGLLAVSGMSADTRELREHLSDHAVNLAVNMFCYRALSILARTWRFWAERKPLWQAAVSGKTRL